MIRIKMIVAVAVCAALGLSACTAGTRFVLPEGTRVYLPAKDMTSAAGRTKSRPFSWGSFGGIKFQLLDAKGQTVKEGQLDSDFRILSFFWPPFAILYWPVGYEWSCYDLTGSEPMRCYR